MKHLAGRILLGSLLVMATGCNGPAPQDAEPNTVTVTFINDVADSDVSITFFSSANASASPDDLTDESLSERLGFSLDANDSFPLVRACTDFRAAIVATASLIVETGTGATASTPILVDGMDFACGNFITFRLTSQGPEDLQIEVSIGDTNPLPEAANAQKSQGSASHETQGSGPAGNSSATKNTNIRPGADTADGTNSADTNSNGTTD